MRTVLVSDLGNLPYREAWDLQEDLLKQAVEQKTASREGHSSLPVAHRLLLVEHPPVFTLGKNGDSSHVLIPEADRVAQGIDYFHINRGGDITFHGPGQLVVYPILDLDAFRPDLGWYLRSLEETVIRLLAHYGITAGRSAGETGVWLDEGIRGKERKICAMGIRCSRWVTMHGLALNVNTDLRYFDQIIPCGIRGKQVTSMQKELGREVPMTEVKQCFLETFSEVFEVTLTPDPAGLREIPS